jgi:tetratricopeptide (TPR) repeat protein
MTNEERAALEHQIERHVKRGEMGDAYAKVQQLAEAFPDDIAIAGKLIELENSLEPSERRVFAARRHESTGAHKSPVSQAEALAASGRYAEAITIYRALLASRPEWDLVKERLAELFQLAQVATPARPSTESQKTSVLEHLLDRINQRKRTT